MALERPSPRQPTRPIAMPKVTAKWRPSIEQLWERYSYNPLTGRFHRRNTDREITGSVNMRGAYRQHRLGVTIKGSTYNGQYGRIVHAWCTGTWCDGEVDHIDRNTSNNRIWNLRGGTTRSNQLNKARAKGGCYYSKHHRKWCAQIELGTRENRKNKNLGRYATEAEARAAYLEACCSL